jgi:FAD/FMN-containing dehydrogenase/Fe-S oxidoreductase
MKIQRDIKRLQRDIRHLIQGDVFFDDISRIIYGTAACIFQLIPLGCVCPRGREDVKNILKYCYKNNISVTARGAGSAVAGQTVGEGIIIDFSKYINKIIEVNPDEGYVKVEPGVVLARLNKELAKYGLWFPPDPSSENYCTIGGMIANNSSGAHSLKYGSTKNYVSSMDVILASGEEVNLERINLSKPQSMPNRLGEIQQNIYKILNTNKELLQSNRPDVLKNSSGYNVFEVVNGDFIDLTKLLVGSEGTLALTVSAKLRVIKKPPVRGYLRVYFDSTEKACETVMMICEFSPSALEIIDKTTMDLVRGSNLELSESIPVEAEAILLAEFDGETREDVETQLDSISRLVTQFCSWEDVKTSTKEAELWKLREMASPILNRMKGPLQSMRLVEDGCINPQRLLKYISGIKGIFKKQDIKSVIYGHAGSGNLHVNILVNPHEQGYQNRLKILLDEVSNLVIDLKGTLSGEHGDGLLRTPYLSKVFKETYDAFKEIKGIFDPKGILNPGKKVCTEKYDPLQMLKPIYTPQNQIVSGEFTVDFDKLKRCSNCGACRNYCPPFYATIDEHFTPRAKAALLTAISQGRLDYQTLLLDKTLKENLNTCIDCKLCNINCPSLADIPGLCLEIKNRIYLKKGLSLRDKILSHPKTLSKFLTNIPTFVSLIIKNPLARFVIEKVVGISHKSPLPMFHRICYFPQNRDRYDKKVVYFPCCFTEYNDPETKEGVFSILEKIHCKIETPNLRCCGVAAFCNGKKQKVIEDGLYNIIKLYDFVEDGFDIVIPEASCLMMIKLEYPNLFDFHRAREVASHSFDFAQYIVKKEPKPRFKKGNLKVYLHFPCHLRAAGSDLYAIEALKLIEGLKIYVGENGCCGMAGTFGIKKANYSLAKEISKSLSSDIAQKAPDIIVTSCGSCKTQISSTTNIRTVHIARFLYDMLSD